MRRRVLVGVGLRQAAALAAAQSRRSAARFVTALEHCDMVAAVLCGITDPAQVPRSICAMGHKWMWNAALGGLPPEEFLTAVDPLLAGVRAQARRPLRDVAIRSPGRLTPEWAEQLGLRAGIPIPVGAFDAHWDAIGAGVRDGRRRQRRRHVHLHHGDREASRR